MGNTELSKWYYSLSSIEAKKNRAKICTSCYITRNVFYNYINGRTFIPTLVKKEIEKIIDQKIFK